MVTRHDLAAHMRSTRRRLLDDSGEFVWTVTRLHEEISRFQAEGHRGCDPVVAGALQRLIDGGADRTYWHVKALYQAEDISRDRTPSQGGELVWFYDEMFNNGQPFLTEMWDRCGSLIRPARAHRGHLSGDEFRATMCDGLPISPCAMVLTFRPIWSSPSRGGCTTLGQFRGWGAGSCEWGRPRVTGWCDRHRGCRSPTPSLIALSTSR